ncbi:MAG TPA: hypothetical protein VGL33_19795 [Streptosporangiaceae bacterium]
MTTTYPESPGTHTIVLPGGGYAAHAPHEAEPVASWLSEIGVPASVFRYPLNVRHPAPLDALRAEIRRRADGAQRIGLIGFSAGGHLAGLAALAPGAAPDQTVQFAVLGYAITSMETETYRPARLILLGEDASPQLRRSTSLDSLVTPESPPFFVWHTAEDPLRSPRTHLPLRRRPRGQPCSSRRARVRSRSARPRPGPGRWPDRDLDHAGGSLDPGTGGTAGIIQLAGDHCPRPVGGAHGCINRCRPGLRQVYALPPGRRSRSCANNCGGKQMNGSQQRADPKLCWNCGKRGVPGVGSRMTCSECEVTWMPWSSAARGDPEKVCWEGAVIFCVDFSRPGALGAPA